MKLNETKKVDTNKHELEFIIEADTIKGAVSTVYKREAKKYNVPGFRKGKAPRNLIEKMYGSDVFLYDAVNEVFPDEYALALKEAGLEPVGQPEVDLVSASMADGAVLTAIVVVKPEMKLGKYEGLKATKFIEKAKDEDIDSEVEAMRQRNARMITREGAAESGDIANINYEGFVDEVPFDGGKDEGHDLTLGSNQFIPGFEDQVIGHSEGEEFDVKVTFPTEYHADNLAGKEAVFKVKINSIQQKELPELDDEFAKDVSEYDTLAELKDSIRKTKQDELDKQADLEVENALIDQVVEAMEGEIPEEMYENRIDEMARDFSFRLEQQGMNLPTYMQYTGMDEASFRDGFKESAEKQVKIRLALEAVVKAQEIVATEEDLEAEVNRIAEAYNMEKEQVEKLVPVEDVKKDLAVNKAIDHIKSSAKITEEEKKEEVKEEKKKPAAKKPAAKKKKEEAKPE